MSCLGTVVAGAFMYALGASAAALLTVVCIVFPVLRWGHRK